jgi:hypothetical protein
MPLVDNHATTSACDAAQKLYETGVDEMSWDDMDVLQAPPAYPPWRTTASAALRCVAF